MANNTILNPGALGDTIATLDVAGVKHELVITEHLDGGGNPVQDSATNPHPVTDAVSEGALLSIAGEDFATHAAQIDNSQKTQIVDAAGNQVTVTGNKLDVNAVFSGDIEIGAVELKNGTDDTRAIVTPANALKVDGSAVTQPVSGTFFQATQPVSGTVAVSNLPATQPVSGTVAVSNFPATQPVSVASLPLPSGAATAALQTQPGVDIGDVTVNNAAGASAVNVQDGGNSITVDQPTGTNLHTVVDSGTITTVSAVTAITNALPAGNNNIGDVDIASIAAGSNIIGNVRIDQTTPGTTNGVQVNAALPVGANVIGKVSIDQATPGTTNLVALTAETTKVIGTVNWPSATTATLSNVNDQATNITLLASNASRKMATIFNDSTVALYVKFGATASLTSFTVKIASQGYYELPTPVYTGILDGIWDSDQSGAARVTEW